jgi:hypothetical protein
MTTKNKSHDRMSAAELREATRQYNRELPVGPDGLPGRAMTRTERARWNKVHKKMGRPTIGKGSKRVMISMEKGLLKTADDFAKERGLTRAGLIAQSIRAYIAGAA